MTRELENEYPGSDETYQHVEGNAFFWVEISRVSSLWGQLKREDVS